MRVFLLLLLVIPNLIWACGEDSKAFDQSAFARLYNTDSTLGLATYQVYLPTEIGDNELGSVYAHIPKLYWLPLRTAQDDEYQGLHTLAILSINPKHTDRLTLHGNYHPKPDEDGGFTFCVDQKQFKLSELLKAEVPAKRPVK